MMVVIIAIRDYVPAKEMFPNKAISSGSQRPVRLLAEAKLEECKSTYQTVLLVVGYEIARGTNCQT